MTSKPPLIAHIVYRLDYGGLENGLINLLNNMPAERFRHAVICLTAATAFGERIDRSDIPLISLGKREGKDLPAYWRLWRTLRKLQPDIVHTRNLGTMDCAWVAWLAGVPHRVHGEHGWDIVDLHGENIRYRRLRKLLSVPIQKFITVSTDLQRWLLEVNGVSAERVSNISNGVDTSVFHPRKGPRQLLPESLRADGTVVFGTVGRMHPVKNSPALARAFISLLDSAHVRKRKVGLVMIGDGPLREEVEGLLYNSGANVWVPGARDDVADIMRELDVFVLPSLNEGMSNTILEAMATGLPVIATNVGGNSQLVEHSVTGLLCAGTSDTALREAMASYLDAAELIEQHGRAGRRRVLEAFSLDSMVGNYARVYDELLQL